MRHSYTTSDSTLQLDLTPGGPRREALEDALRAAIRSGRLGPGDRIPSTRALALDLGLSRGTVVEAYTQLTAEGYLDAERGSGTRVSQLGPSALAVGTEAVGPRERARYSFHPGLPDLTAFPRAAWTAAARRGLRDVAAHELGYGDPRGRAELRAELSRYLGRARGAAADPERIVVCAGFQHGLSLLCRALRRHGARRIAMEDPCLPNHRETAAAAGLEVIPLPVDEHGARTDLLARCKVAAVVLGPAHQYPLGVVLHPERRAAAVAWARWSGGLLIEDDYDAELRFDRAPIGVLQALDPDCVAYGGSVSKTLAPGLRLGWLLAPGALVGSLAAIRATEDVHVPVTSQLALTEMLRSGRLRTARQADARPLSRPAGSRRRDARRAGAVRARGGDLRRPQSAPPASSGTPQRGGACGARQPGVDRALSRRAVRCRDGAPRPTASSWATAPFPSTTSRQASTALGDVLVAALGAN